MGIEANSGSVYTDLFEKLYKELKIVLYLRLKIPISKLTYQCKKTRLSPTFDRCFDTVARNASETVVNHICKFTAIMLRILTKLQNV